MKLKTFWKVAIPVVVLLGGGLGVWASGGFDDRQTNWVTLPPGESIDIGPMTFTPLRAIAKHQAVDSDPNKVVITVQGECLNTTEAELQTTSNIDAAAFYLTDTEQNPVDQTRIGADSISLDVGTWDLFSNSEAFNPTDIPMKCLVRGEFKSGLLNSAEIRLVVAQVEPTEGQYKTVDRFSYRTRDDLDPYQIVLPLTWEDDRT